MEPIGQVVCINGGEYGDYWTTEIAYSKALTEEQMKMNANFIFNYLTDRGWTRNAIAGMLGNMQVESTLNPGRWQNDDPTNQDGGYGLVQWTPASNYIDWALDEGLIFYRMESNLARIEYELENGLQWIATEEYNFSFKDFTVSTESPEYLASAFLKCYERAGVEVESVRRSNARAWYNWDFTEVDPQPPTIKKKKKRFKFVLFKKRKAVHYNATTRF